MIKPQKDMDDSYMHIAKWEKPVWIQPDDILEKAVSIETASISVVAGDLGVRGTK